MNSNLYKQILDNLYYDIVITDDKGIILYCNKALSKNHDINYKKMIGKHVSVISRFNNSGQIIIPIALKTKKDISLFKKTIYNKKLFLNTKPIFNSNITMLLENVLEILGFSTSNKNSSVDPNISNFFSIDIIKNLKKISKFDVTVLLLGESGTGKSTCAKFIHDLSSRYDKPFFTINCTTIPENLIESELFGYAKGAFTGAMKEGKKGLVELADTGTLFLDEIGELPLIAQSKLLELIENKTYMKVGGTTKNTANIRILAATNRNLKNMVKEKTFREDLYYRLNTFELILPPLRERKDNIPILSNIFINKINKKYGLNKKFSNNVLVQFKNYNWPGNLRQLEHTIEKLIIASEQDLITINSIYNENSIYKNKEDVKLNQPNLKDELEKIERSLIEKAYLEYGSSYKIAKALGISQSQASRKMRKYNIKEKVDIL